MKETKHGNSDEIEVTDQILHDHNHDGIDRRGFLKCMAWAGTGAFCVIKGGVLSSYSLGRFSPATVTIPTVGAGNLKVNGLKGSYLSI